MASEKELNDALTFFESGAKAIRLVIDTQQLVSENEKLARQNELLSAGTDAAMTKSKELDSAIAAKEQAFNEAQKKYAQYETMEERERRIRDLTKMIKEREKELGATETTRRFELASAE